MSVQKYLIYLLRISGAQKGNSTNEEYISIQKIKPNICNALNRLQFLDL